MWNDFEMEIFRNIKTEKTSISGLTLQGIELFLLDTYKTDFAQYKEVSKTYFTWDKNIPKHNISNFVNFCTYNQKSSMTILRIWDEEEKFRHVSVLIFRKPNVLERYDPDWFPTNRLSKWIDEYISASIDKNIIYIPASKLCHRGPQNIFETRYDNGYCTIWCLYFIELLLQNPEETSQRMVERILTEKGYIMRSFIRKYRRYLLSLYEREVFIFKNVKYTDQDYHEFLIENCHLTWNYFFDSYR